MSGSEPTPSGVPAPEPAASDGPTNRQMLVAIMLNLFLDAGLSVLAYGVARLLGYSPFVALVAGALVAGTRAVYVIIRRREADPFALFMVGIFVVGLLLSFVTGSPRFLLVKESFGTGAAGLAFVLTCLRGKPLAYHASQRVAAPTVEERAQWTELWTTEPTFRRRFRIMSLVIGGALLLEALVRIPLIFVLPIDVMAVLSPALTPVVITLTSIWSIRYGTATEEVLRAEGAAAAAESGYGPDHEGSSVGSGMNDVTYFSVHDGTLRIESVARGVTWEGLPDGLEVLDVKPAPDQVSAFVLLDRGTAGGRLHNLVRLGARGQVVWRAELPPRTNPDFSTSFELSDRGEIEASAWSGYAVTLDAGDGQLTSSEFAQ